MFNEGNQIHNFISSSGSGTVINYGSGSSSDFLTRSWSGSTTLGAVPLYTLLFSAVPASCGAKRPVRQLPGTWVTSRCRRWVGSWAAVGTLSIRPPNVPTKSEQRRPRRNISSPWLLTAPLLLSVTSVHLPSVVNWRGRKGESHEIRARLSVPSPPLCCGARQSWR